MPYEKRLVVIGTSGSGKTTLAATLATQLGIPHIELDALYWQSNWQETPDAILRERVQQKISQPEWVVDGNYSKIRDLVWGRATTIIWLDFGRLLVMRRLLRRTIQRSLFRQKLWNDNQENFRLSFFSRDSVLYWGWVSHAQLREKYLPIFEQDEKGQSSPYPQLTFVRLRTPKAVQEWLASLH